GSPASRRRDDRGLPLDQHGRHKADQEKHQGQRGQQEKGQRNLAYSGILGTELQGSKSSAENVHVCQVGCVALNCNAKLVVQVRRLLRKRGYIVRIHVREVEGIAQEEDERIRKTVPGEGCL